MKKSREQLLREHEKYIKRFFKRNYKERNTKRKSYLYNIFKTETFTRKVSPTSDIIPTGGGFKKSLDDYKWKRGIVESKETIEAIEHKKKQIQPLYNKGGLQYITPDIDLTKMGKKI